MTDPVLPRLLLAGNCLSASGGRRSVIEDLADRLVADGHKVIRVSPYRNGWARGLHMVATAALRLRDFDLAVVDLYSGRAFAWGEAMTRMLSALGRPVVLVLRGGELPEFARRRPARVARCLATAAHVVAPSLYLAEQMKPYRTGIQLLPNPVDIDAYRFRLRDRPRPHLVWLRALHAVYNPALAPQVLARLVGEHSDAVLEMYGPDKGDGSVEAVRRVSRDLGISERVLVRGPVTKTSVPECLARADIFLNTTDVDNTPVSVLEAMACGLCVVSTNVGGLPYLLSDGRNALLVPPRDPDAMAASVSRILARPDLAARLSASARATAEQCDWPQVYEQWNVLLAGMAGRKAHAGAG